MEPAQCGVVQTEFGHRTRLEVFNNDIGGSHQLVRSLQAAGRVQVKRQTFFLRLNMTKNPAPEPSKCRVLSPAKGSILMTSAPRSASTMPQDGPIAMCENSMTRNPCNGRRAFVMVDSVVMCHSITIFRRGRVLCFQELYTPISIDFKAQNTP